MLQEPLFTELDIRYIFIKIEYVMQDRDESSLFPNAFSA